MKILGIGVDIINNKRIRQASNNRNFIKRIFGNNEIKLSKKKLTIVISLPKDLLLKKLLLNRLGSVLEIT